MIELKKESIRAEAVVIPNLPEKERIEKLEKLIELYEDARIFQEDYKELQGRLEHNREYRDLIELEQKLVSLKTQAKELSKEILKDGEYTASGFVFEKSTSKRASRNWFIEDIKKQKWGPAVIIETVDEKVFKALSKTLDNPEQYYTETYKPYAVYSMIQE